jgi:hypothetical protein
MSVILDFDQSKRSAFLRGFAKGLAAPVVLFSTHTLPQLAPVAPIVPPSHPGGDAGAMSSDWARVGSSLRAAVACHVKAEQDAETAAGGA